MDLLWLQSGPKPGNRYTNPSLIKYVPKTHGLMGLYEAREFEHIPKDCFDNCDLSSIIKNERGAQLVLWLARLFY